MGGADHTVLIEVEAGATMTIANKLRFKPDKKINLLIYWQYLGPDSYDVRIKVQRQWALTDLAGSFQINPEGSDNEADWVKFDKFFELMKFASPVIDSTTEVRANTVCRCICSFQKYSGRVS
jgi:hypothetical protein